MNLRKTIKISLWLCFFLFFFKKPVWAQNNSFITIVNPIRGGEFLSSTGTLLEKTMYQKELADSLGLSATWLLRSDAITSASFSAYFKSLQPKDELGIFLEILPSLARESSVSYPRNGLFWHDANKIFLSGYIPEDRKKLIDTVFLKFKKVFGYFPKSVGAWHIDAYSAEYMRQKYGVTGVLICADQFGTDSYQIWGGWWGVPFYPSKYNILIPAQTLKNKLNLVVFWWAARDPKLGYGGSVVESTYSVQANDYLQHGLGINYFKKLLDEYLKNPKNQFGQITIGLENDNDWTKLGNEFQLQIEEVKRREKEEHVQVITMSEFSDWYKEKFKNLSPEHFIGNWYQSIYLRTNIIKKDNQDYLLDLRVYNENWPEANLSTANPWSSLSLNNPYKVDTVRFTENRIELPSNISLKKIISQFGQQKIPFEINKFLIIIFYIFLIIIIFLRKNLLLSLLILLGTVCLSLPMVKSGLIYPYGMGFWGPNGHDGIWHVTLINELSHFSLQHPLFSGATLTNYHFGFDFFTAIIHLISRIPVINLYFQVLPPIIAILLGILTYKVVISFTNSKKMAWWSIFFVYFGGSWGWLVGLLKNGEVGGESMFWANQAISTLVNPPYALSLIIILSALLLLKKYIEKSSLKNLILCSIFWGILLQIKVYAGIITLGSLAIIFFVSLIRKEKWQDMGKLFGLSLFISLITFLPFNLKASSLLVFSPLWFSGTMLAFGDRLGWFKLENARLAYFESGQYLKWFLAEGLALFIFIFGNIGTRVLGLIAIKNFIGKIKSLSWWQGFLLSSLLISLLMPLLFIQKGNPWNTIQFFYYFQFFLAILAGMALGQWWEVSSTRKSKTVVMGLVSFLIILLTLPTTIITLKENYLSSRPPSRISFEELEALAFLRSQPNGIVLSYPYDKAWREKFSEPKPLYAYETTGYISALSGQPSYLADEMNLEISQYNYLPRREEVQRFFVTNDISFARELIKREKISYLYLVKGQKINLGQGDINANKIFENGEVVIYKIN